MVKPAQTKKLSGRGIKKHAEPQYKHTLSGWVIGAPIRFAVMSLGMAVIISAIYGAIASMLNIALNINVITTLAIIVNTLIIWRVIKWLNTNSLSQRDYAAVSNGLAIALCVTIMAFIIGFMKFTLLVWQAQVMLSVGSKTWFVVLCTIILGLIATYMLGLVVVNIYAIYLRCRTFGMGRATALCTLPFGIMWVPAYVLKETNNVGDSVEIRNRTFATVVDWIVSMRRNTYLSLGVLCLVYMLCGGIGLPFIVTVAVPLILFLVWVAITGHERLRKNINGAYARVAIVLNIAMVVFALATMAFFTPTPVPQPLPDNVEIINITDTAQQQ
ncbi:MAG: hypothetical protein IJ560_04520 [Alphaproteobacteria bacterium]|nr:hypothetical protein [Alphaproteobacteria bacterium]